MTKDDYEEEYEETNIAKGFDREIDYKSIKERLINEYNIVCDKLQGLSQENKSYNYDLRVLTNRKIYLLTALLQLKNGSRIIEACKTIKIFIKNNDLTKKVKVKIAKSECLKRGKDGKEFVTKKRVREMTFPKWINLDIDKNIQEHLDRITITQLKQRVLTMLIRDFKCNTHSLRYSFINYMLYEKKIEMGLVCKFVGHVDVSQLVRYTTLKNTQNIHEID